MIEILKELIRDFQTEKPFTGTARNLPYELAPGKVFVCIGVRRCGKSTMMNQIAVQLHADGAPWENFLSLTFSDNRLDNLKHGSLEQILDAYYSMYPRKKKTEVVHCFFDEIQDISNWELFIARLLRSEKCRIYLTGSSATMLSKEIATQLRGRSLAWELFPFSFAEFLAHRGIHPKDGTSKERHLVQHAFEEYREKGGFPEIFDFSKKLRIMTHQEYYKSILLRDVVERHDAPHPQAVADLAARLISNAGALYSLNRLQEYLRSVGHGLTKDFVHNCVQWFEDAFFLFSVRMYTPSLARQNTNPKKIYCVDHGMLPSLNPSILANRGHILENMVFSHLRRNTQEIYYYKTNAGNEVDFLWIDATGRKRLLQVCHDISAPDTRKRELAGLTQAMRELGLSESEIVTDRTAETVKNSGQAIHIIPIWKWLLDK